jgi:D-serine deaminase-like pyridoxal phosphate-dependent protein
MQVEASKGVRALIASTMPEVFQIIDSGVVAEGKVDDVSTSSFAMSIADAVSVCDSSNQILYSLPISVDKLGDILFAQEAMDGKGVMRLMVDHASQIEFLYQYKRPDGGKWSVFVKVDGGGK